MKVLLLPVNIASDISHKVRALREIGVDARGFSIAASRIQSGDDVRVFSNDGANPISRGIRRRVFLAQMWKMIAWADDLHWVADANLFARGWNASFLRWIDKPGVVQWMGSEIRVPEQDFDVNPYYREAFREDYEYQSESLQTSLSHQQFFANLGYSALEFIGMERYINPELFPKRFRTWQHVFLPDYLPNYPDPTKARPLVVHSPSAPVAKGTKHVLRAVEQLKGKCRFDFVLIENTPRPEALKIVGDCDIYIDQLILGSHGYAAVEAMAFGKPVVCYINPEIGKNYPEDLPIVNANPDNITEQLEVLIRDAELRHEIGRRSRAYAEKYHDDKKIAAELLSVYEEVIALHKNRREKG